MPELPSGTVTFLFTDLEGSTRLWERHPAEMVPALERHDALLRDAVEDAGGVVVKTTGDGLHGVFTTTRAALDAALAAERSTVVSVRTDRDENVALHRRIWEAVARSVRAAN